MRKPLDPDRRRGIGRIAPPHAGHDRGPGRATAIKILIGADDAGIDARIVRHRTVMERQAKTQGAWTAADTGRAADRPDMAAPAWTSCDVGYGRLRDLHQARRTVVRQGAVAVAARQLSRPGRLGDHPRPSARRCRHGVDPAVRWTGSGGEGAAARIDTAPPCSAACALRRNGGPTPRRRISMARSLAKLLTKAAEPPTRPVPARSGGAVFATPDTISAGGRRGGQGAVENDLDRSFGEAGAAETAFSHQDHLRSSCLTQPPCRSWHGRHVDEAPEPATDMPDSARVRLRHPPGAARGVSET
ncbi:MAG: hypothetical protein ACJA1L_002733 [Paracoccaceae bacterium]|jgi:hypothetical protein